MEKWIKELKIGDKVVVYHKQTQYHILRNGAIKKPDYFSEEIIDDVTRKFIVLIGGDKFAKPNTTICDYGIELNDYREIKILFPSYEQIDDYLKAQAMFKKIERFKSWSRLNIDDLEVIDEIVERYTIKAK